MECSVYGSTDVNRGDGRLPFTPGVSLLTGREEESYIRGRRLRLTKGGYWGGEW